MPFQLVTQLSFTAAVGGGSEVKTFTSSLKQNDVAVITLGTDGNIFSDGGLTTSGYTDIDKYNGNSPGTYVGWKRMGSTPDTNVTIGQNSASMIAGVVQVWRGIDTTTAMDATAVGTSDVATNTKPDCGSITTVTNGALVLITAVLDDDDDAANVTAPAGYTNLIAKDTGQGSAVAGATVMMASRIVSVAGAEDPAAWGMVGEDTWRAWSIALRPNAAGIPGRTNNNIAAIRNSHMITNLRRGMKTGRRK